MFFSQPFILASEFIQHVGLLVLFGLIVLEYVIHAARTDEDSQLQKANIHSIGIAVFFLAVWVIGEYFIPVKTLTYTVLVQIPFVITIMLFLIHVVLPATSQTLVRVRTWTVGIFLVHTAISTAGFVFSIPEISFIHALFKSTEVVLIYAFVVQLFQYTNMLSVPSESRSSTSAYKFSTIAQSSVLSVLLFGIVTLGSFGIPSEAHAINLITRIGDQSTEVKPGDRLYFDVEIKWPENPKRQDLRVEYQILDKGEIIASEKVLRAVETQASFLDYLVVPTNTSAGIKQLNIVIETYDLSLKENVAATFHVTKTGNQLMLYFLILASAIVLVVILVVFQIMMISRTQKLLAARQTI